MEYILRESESISLVFMARCANLFKHSLGMAQAGQVFGRIVKSDDEHVLFLFNHYPAEPGEMDDMSQEERQEYVEKIILKDATDMVEESYNAEAAFLKKLADEYQEAGGENADEMVKDDKEYQEVSDNRRYLHVMLRALVEGEAKKGAIGFIDPTSDYSIGLLKKALKELKPISKNFLSFDGCSEEALQFKSYVTECRELHISVLNGEELCQRYPVDLITRACEMKKKENEQHKQAIVELKDGKEDRIRFYESKYKLDVFEAKANELKKEKEENKKEIKLREGWIKEIEEAKPVLYYEDSWSETSIHVSEHIVRYPPGESVPFDHYKPILDNETEKVKVVSTSPKDFEIHYDFRPGGKRIAAGIGAGVAAAGGAALTIVSLGLALPVAAAGGAGVGAALMKTFKGKVEFYVKPKDIPDNAEKIKRWKKEKNDLELKVKILDEKINSLIQSSTSQLGKRVQTMLDSSKKELETLEHFKTFENAVHQLYEKRLEDMKQFFEFVKQFYPNQESFNEFLQLYETVTCGKVEAEKDEKQIPIDSLVQVDLEKKYAESFPDLWTGN